MNDWNCPCPLSRLLTGCWRPRTSRTTHPHAPPSPSLFARLGRPTGREDDGDDDETWTIHHGNLLRQCTGSLLFPVSTPGIIAIQIGGYNERSAIDSDMGYLHQKIVTASQCSHASHHRQLPSHKAIITITWVAIAIQETEGATDQSVEPPTKKNQFINDKHKTQKGRDEMVRQSQNQRFAYFRIRHDIKQPHVLFLPFLASLDPPSRDERGVGEGAGSKVVKGRACLVSRGKIYK